MKFVEKQGQLTLRTVISAEKMINIMPLRTTLVHGGRVKHRKPLDNNTEIYIQKL